MQLPVLCAARVQGCAAAAALDRGAEQGAGCQQGPEPLSLAHRGPQRPFRELANKDPELKKCKS